MNEGLNAWPTRVAGLGGGGDREGFPASGIIPTGGGVRKWGVTLPSHHEPHVIGFPDWIGIMNHRRRKAGPAARLLLPPAREVEYLRWQIAGDNAPAASKRF